MTAEPTATGDETRENGRPGQSVRSRSQHQRRKRIVQAAAALGSRGGIEAMQMRTVSERAGVALGTLYRYFPSKEDLIAEVYRTVFLDRWRPEWEMLLGDRSRPLPSGEPANDRWLPARMAGPSLGTFSTPSAVGRKAMWRIGPKMALTTQ